MLRKNTIKDSLGDRIFMLCIYLFLIIVLCAVMYPLLFIISSSFSSSRAVVSGSVWLFPVDFTTRAYAAIFNSKQIMMGYYNSIVYMVFGTMINLLFTVLIAYPLSQKHFYGRGIVMTMMMVTVFFGGGLIPDYLLVKNLGLLDTRWALWLPGAFGVFNVIVARTFFQTSIPPEMQEAAQIDGCGDTRYLVSIVLPLSKPILAVMTLFYAVGHWNAFFSALIYLRSEELFPLQYVLRNILILNATDPEMMAASTQEMRDQGFQQVLKYAVIVAASLPVLLIYPFVQRHFVKGVMIGSLKG